MNTTTAPSGGEEKPKPGAELLQIAPMNILAGGPQRITRISDTEFQYTGSVIFPDGKYKVNPDILKDPGHATFLRQIYQGLISAIDGDTERFDAVAKEVLSLTMAPGFHEIVALSWANIIDEKKLALKNGYTLLDLMILDDMVRPCFEQQRDKTLFNAATIIYGGPFMEGGPILRSVRTHVAERLGIEVRQDVTNIDDLKKSRLPHIIRKVLTGDEWAHWTQSLKKREIGRNYADDYVVYSGSNGDASMIHAIQPCERGGEILYVSKGRSAIELERYPTSDLGGCIYHTPTQNTRPRDLFRIVDSEGSHYDKKKVYEEVWDGQKGVTIEFHGYDHRWSHYYPEYCFKLTHGLVKCVFDAIQGNQQPNENENPEGLKYLK